MRYIFLLLLVGLSIGAFVMVINPKYKSIKTMRADVASYGGRLETAKKLKASREDLIARYNSISKVDLDNLKTLLPDSVDNIRLIIQLDSLATKNGLSSLRNVQYDTSKADKLDKPDPAALTQNSYGEFNISFDTSGQYKNFLAFVSDLEQNLRLVDVSTVTFGQAGAADRGLTDSLKYSITLKTYWLKK